jgi:hypothetical protein
MAGHEGPRCVATVLPITVKVDDTRVSTDSVSAWGVPGKRSVQLMCR